MTVMHAVAYTTPDQAEADGKGFYRLLQPGEVIPICNFDFASKVHFGRRAKKSELWDEVFVLAKGDGFLRKGPAGYSMARGLNAIPLCTDDPLAIPGLSSARNIDSLLDCFPEGTEHLFQARWYVFDRTEGQELKELWNPLSERLEEVSILHPDVSQPAPGLGFEQHLRRSQKAGTLGLGIVPVVNSRNQKRYRFRDLKIKLKE